MYPDAPKPRATPEVIDLEMEVEEDILDESSRRVEEARAEAEVAAETVRNLHRSGMHSAAAAAEPVAEAAAEAQINEMNQRQAAFSAADQEAIDRAIRISTERIRSAAAGPSTEAGANLAADATVTAPRIATNARFTAEEYRETRQGALSETARGKRVAKHAENRGKTSAIYSKPGQFEGVDARGRLTDAEVEEAEAAVRFRIPITPVVNRASVPGRDERPRSKSPRGRFTDTVFDDNRAIRAAISNIEGGFTEGVSEEASERDYAQRKSGGQGRMR
jgi:hypothetical protein